MEEINVDLYSSQDKSGRKVEPIDVEPDGQPLQANYSADAPRKAGASFDEKEPRMHELISFRFRLSISRSFPFSYISLSAKL